MCSYYTFSLNGIFLLHNPKVWKCENRLVFDEFQRVVTIPMFQEKLIIILYLVCLSIFKKFSYFDV